MGCPLVTLLRFIVEHRVPVLTCISATACRGRSTGGGKRPKATHCMFGATAAPLYPITQEGGLYMQVTGFIVNPREPGRRFVEGVLVPY